MEKKVQHPRLLRGLSFTDSTALIVGNIIGTGIFLKAAIMAQLLGSPWLVLLAWFGAGLLSLAGALTYSELGCLFPKAGGEYVYLKEAYGNLPAFLYGWMRFWIGGPGSIAAFAVGTASFISGVILIESQTYRSMIAVGLIVILTSINSLSVALGGRIVTVLTAIKLFLIISLPIASFILIDSSNWSRWSLTTMSGVSWSSFGSAMVAALWAFDGWNNLPMMAGEVHQPEKNIPRALILGSLIVLGVYSLVNVGYFLALPLNEVVSSASKLYPQATPVAGKVAETLFGPLGLFLFSILLVISALGAMNGCVMSSSRVPYALAKDGLFPKILGEVSLKNHVPYMSLIIQGLVAILLALSGSFDQLTDYVVFASWIFYALVALSIFIFRKKIPHAKRAYKVIGYPIVPAIFIVLAILLVGNSLISSFKQSLFGLIFILAGVPVYWLFSKKK